MVRDGRALHEVGVLQPLLAEGALEGGAGGCGCARAGGGGGAVGGGVGRLRGAGALLALLALARPLRQVGRAVGRARALDALRRLARRDGRRAHVPAARGTASARRPCATDRNNAVRNGAQRAQSSPGRP